MICSNCGKECESHSVIVQAFQGSRTGREVAVSDCCHKPIDPHCPCPSESPENCQACQTTRDIRKLQRENEQALSELYSKDQIREILNQVGVSGYVRDLIMERFK